MHSVETPSAPSISLLIRSMNRATLAPILEELNASPYPNLEVIVVNASGHAHAALPTVSYNLRLAEPEPRRPLPRAEAANLALEAVSTPLAMFLDDDDSIDSQHLTRLVTCLEEHPQAAAAYAGVRLLREGEQVAVRDAPWHDGALWLVNFLPIHAVLFRMAAVHEGQCRFDTDFEQLEDWDFWLQLAHHGGAFVHCPGVSASYWLDRGASGLSAQRDLRRYDEARQAIYRKWLPHIPTERLGRVIAQWVDSLEQAQWDRDQLHRQEREHNDKHAALWSDYHALGAQVERLKANIEQLEQIANERETQLGALHRQLDTMRQEHETLLHSRSWRITAPLRAGARAMRRLRVRPAHAAQDDSQRMPPVQRHQPQGAVDVIVPVYKGLEETRDCLESVWRSTPRQAYRLVVINDASPEPEVTAWLREVAAADDPQRPLTLLENSENLGFVGTVNRGMALSSSADVVLLNSDAEVINDWLDRLINAAYLASDRPVATVTPFSNNATICSYPRFCEDNELPHGLSLGELDACFARANAGQTVEIPTGIGFCLYIRRDSLDDVGLFDEQRFGKGYGEENDFCMRALEAGWRNVHALDVFAWHKGSVSFGDTQPARVTQALQILHELHPTYESRVYQFIQRDPAQLARHRVDLLRLRDNPRPRVLLVNHQRGGGTEQHCRELADALEGQVEFLMLRPAPDGVTQLTYYAQREALSLDYRLPEEFDALVALLKALGVARVHFHHWLGLDGSVMHLAKRLGVPQWATLHDYYAACPQITLTGPDNRYCGEQGIEQCRDCLRRAPASGGVPIESWRDEHRRWLGESERVIVPSHDAATRLAGYFPEVEFEAIPHPDAETVQALYPPPAAPSVADDQPLRVAIIGAVSVIKGADEIEAAAREAQKRGLNIEFRLFGYAYRDLAALHTLHVTGPYDSEDLSAMLRDWQPHVVWFPARWPETYSYTLSTCLTLGLPVVSTDLGAIAERIAQRPLSWRLPVDTTATQWCDWFETLGERLQEKSEQATWQLSEPATFYRHRYNQGLVVPEALGQLPEDWSMHAQSRTSSSSSVRLKAVEILYWLRRQAWLQSVARRIPLAWQRRIKSWLLREST